MNRIRNTGFCLILFGFFSHIISCGKKDSSPAPTPLIDSVAQDASYRIGKWYSVSNGAGYNFSSNPLLDTIWFTSDTTAGWTDFGGNPWLFRPTYFLDPYHIVYITPDPIHSGKIDTISHECVMSGDTFIIYWDESNYEVFPEHYLKMKN